MPTISHRIKYLLLITIISMGLLACGQEKPTSIPLATATKDIFAYHTYTVVPPSPTRESVTPIPLIPDPTATPFSYMIEKGDTLLGIAIRYGIDIEDLQAANPNIDPNLLIVGSQVIIPFGDDIQSSMMTPTPVPITLQSPSCHQTGDGGAWCFILVENRFSYALENISARVRLIAQEGSNNLERVAFPPLNRVGPGKNVPLMVFFPAPIPATFSVKADLLTAVRIPEISSRYLNGEVEINDIDINNQGRIANVTGQLKFPDNMEYPGLVWLIAIAYGDDGQVVGVRRWEMIFPHEVHTPVSSETPQVVVTTTPITILPVSFQVDVYSLGPEIKRVEVLIEARP